MRASCAQRTLRCFTCAVFARRSLKSVQIRQDELLLIIRNTFLVLVLGFRAIGVERNDSSQIVCDGVVLDSQLRQLGIVGDRCTRLKKAATMNWLPNLLSKLCGTLFGKKVNKFVHSWLEVCSALSWCGWHRTVWLHCIAVCSRSVCVVERGDSRWVSCYSFTVSLHSSSILPGLHFRFWLRVNFTGIIDKENFRSGSRDFLPFCPQRDCRPSFTLFELIRCHGVWFQDLPGSILSEFSWFGLCLIVWALAPATLEQHVPNLPGSPPYYWASSGGPVTSQFNNCCVNLGDFTDPRSLSIETAPSPPDVPFTICKTPTHPNSRRWLLAGCWWNVACENL